MRDILSVINEGIKKDDTDYINLVSNNISFYHGRDEILKLLRGEKATFYHGTNTDFKKFDISKGKKFRNDKFWGHGIFLSPTIQTASRYAHANANNSLDVSVIDKAKKIDKGLGSFMYDLYKKGNSTWSDEKHSDFKEYSYSSKWKFGDIDLNDISDLVQLIPDAQNAKDYAKDDDNDYIEPMDLFGGSTSALDTYSIDMLKELGLGDYRPRILTVEVDPKKSDIFITNKQKDAKKSKADIIIVYDHKDLIDDVAEVIIRNEKLVKIKGIDFDI